MAVDYSLYLVTGRELLPPGKDFYETLDQALQGGVTVVQIREKTTDTGEFLEICQKSKSICDRYNVPLFVNDRVDIALAVGATGVHLGQTDMPISVARKLLPPNTIVGASCNNVGEVRKALTDGADYIGIGAVWATNTKALDKPLVGVRNVGAMLELLDGTSVQAVAIGGIKAHNLLRTMYGSVSRTGHPLNGVAVVSEIMASENPKDAAARLSNTLQTFRSGSAIPLALSFGTNVSTVDKITEQVASLMKHMKEVNPLVHQITNNVAIAQSANITISIGASPIMATTAAEMSDLARVCDGLLVNIGTLTHDAYAGMLEAGMMDISNIVRSLLKAEFWSGRSMNTNRKPIVFDPVGVGATEFRKRTVNELLNTWQTTVIKGNAGELAALSGSTEVESRGVDSVGAGFKDPVTFVRDLARRERKTDYVSDGKSVAILNNGHQYLGQITASGCITGSCVAAYCALASRIERSERREESKLVDGDVFVGAISGILVLNIAAEIAATRGNVEGPGTFFPALLDELARLTPEKVVQRVNIHLA
ncbi:thiamine biosynthetic bifunctional enzyme [Marasmius crinis-equi]|uniref:Thiamine biosynthetic bifunctional enzyme n=1 Tax=Marasmius crinis-equi TaxID=585013 RepID=A0ABR3FH62_9AGAR